VLGETSPPPKRSLRPSRWLRLGAAAGIVALGSLALVGCDGNDTPEGGSVGAGDKGGAAGAAGSSGVDVGKGGKGGKSGASGAGAGGSSGKGGAAGKGGGSAGEGGDAGAGGSGETCSSPLDCPGEDSECGTRTCTDGVCGVSFVTAGTKVVNQLVGDCAQRVCDGSGAVVSTDDTADLPDDQNPCTTDTCEASNGGVAPGHGFAPEGTACGADQVCDGAGKCTGCTAPDQCPGQDDGCRTRTCESSVCGFAFTASGTALPDVVSGDCKRSACDGLGNTLEVSDAFDVPSDATSCTQDLCNAGAPQNVPVGAGTACENGGVCNDAGACVACLTAETCPGQDTECQARTCEDNVCGIAFVENGTAVLNQVTGDCGKNVCDGAGNIVPVVDDTDVGDDSNACTTDACSGGVASHEPLPSETSCGVEQLCNGNGQCVGCVVASDCLGIDDECKQRTCTDGICGVTFAKSGTGLADPVDGDCRTRVCDGSGNAIDAADDTDVRVDGNVCSRDICFNGAPANPASSAGEDCGGGKICSGTGACVECLSAASCPGTDSECQTRTCVKGTCGIAYAPQATPLKSQVAGDCKLSVCDGAGAVVVVDNALDVPNDNLSCTSDVCSGGTPANPPLPAGQSCGASGVCDGSGVCVGCLAPSDCPGVDDACKTRTCTQNVCGISFTAANVAVATQTAGDCRKNVCDGAGNVAVATDTADVPPDDGLFCTTSTCTGQTPSQTPLSAGTTCPNGSADGRCDGAGSCVECLSASECPGQDTDCQTRTCAANRCGFSFAGAGTPLSVQTANDCKKAVCDGSGNVVSANDDTDVPVDDGNECTKEACASGVPSHPALPPTATCSAGGGAFCDGTGSCVVCNDDSQCSSGKVCTNHACVSAAPVVVGVTPADGATSVKLPTTITVSFNTAMAPASLTAQTTSGTCSGTVQVSLDDFATCVAMSTSQGAMSAAQDATTFTPQPGLLVNTVYRVRVTNGAKSATGVPISAAFTQPTGFATGAPGVLCDGSLVLSQVYGGGGGGSATYKSDYVVLHNRGLTSVSLSGKSLQYASATGSSWSVVKLPDVLVPAGSYYLVVLSTGAGLADLPVAADFTSPTSVAMSGTGAKVALSAAVTALSGTCPLGDANVLDFVAYGGTGANCAEGGTAAPTLSATTAALRAGGGCQDLDLNATDFTVGAPTPRNSGTGAVACDCRAVNETDTAFELDYCKLVSPPSLVTTEGFGIESSGQGEVYDAGVTEANGAPPMLAQFGVGPADQNPQYSVAWQWLDASYGGQSGNNDSFYELFPMRAAGAYKYAYRFSKDGRHFTYCDLDGAGANLGLSFSLDKLGTYTVQPNTQPL
jgi:hypothetical protein